MKAEAKLAFSMVENPGVYALLLGSGVSRAASIPTGWEITLDLTRLATASEGVTDRSDWQAWHIKRFGVEPAHDLHPKTLTALKRLVELVTEGGGQLAVILVGHPKLRNDLKRPLMEEIGDRTTVFEFGGLRNRQRDFIDWALRAALSPGIEPEEALADDAAILLAARLKTPLQIGRHLVRAFEAGFDASVKPVDAATIDSILSRQIDDLKPQLTRHGYDTRMLAEQFDAKPAEIRKLLRGGLDPVRTRELTDEMRAAGLPL